MKLNAKWDLKNVQKGKVLDSNLKMNDDKTKYIVFASSRMLTHIECDSININGISKQQKS